MPADRPRGGTVASARGPAVPGLPPARSAAASVLASFYGDHTAFTVTRCTQVSRLQVHGAGCIHYLSGDLLS
jgi:hypothetical protein